MIGRVLSDKEITGIQETFDIATARNNVERGETIIVQNLIFTIHDLQRQLSERDKTIDRLRQTEYVYEELAELMNPESDG